VYTRSLFSQCAGYAIDFGKLNKSNPISKSKSPDAMMAVTHRAAKTMILMEILNSAVNGQNIIKGPIVNSDPIIQVGA